MAKQFVTELRQENSVVILINGVDAKRYNRNPAEFEGYVNPLVANAAEYEEITEGNKVHYWIWVPDLINTDNVARIKMQKKIKFNKRWELERLRDERIERYAQMVKDGCDEIIPTDEDIRYATALQLMIKRKKKVSPELTRALKSALSSISDIAGEDFYDDYHPDSDAGIDKKQLVVNPYNKLTNAYDPIYARTFGK